MWAKFLPKRSKTYLSFMTGFFNWVVINKKSKVGFIHFSTRKTSQQFNCKVPNSIILKLIWQLNRQRLYLERKSCEMKGTKPEAAIAITRLNLGREEKGVKAGWVRPFSVKKTRLLKKMPLQEIPSSAWSGCSRMASRV